MRTNSLKKMIAGAACLGVILTATVVAAPSAAHAAVQSSVASKKADSILSFAKSLQGKVKYQFGVNNPSKLILDCSSFTKYVFGKQGVSLKWGSKAQSKQGKFVSKSNLQKGDLVFFSVSTPGSINHVGIYMGNGNFIHNTTGSTYGVKISKLSDYSKRYITARRVL